MYILSSLIQKELKAFYRKEKRYRWKCAQNRYSGMQIMTAKTTALWTLHVHVVLNSVISRLMLYDIVLYACSIYLEKQSWKKKKITFYVE